MKEVFFLANSSRKYLDLQQHWFTVKAIFSSAFTSPENIQPSVYGLAQKGLVLDSLVLNKLYRVMLVFLTVVNA